MSAPAPSELSPDEKIISVLDALKDNYGTPEQPERDPVEVLIRGILSQNTSDTNSGRAYDNLVDKYDTWQQI
ncbi:MAG: hypothetical protein ACOC2T_04145, partial [Planctomycetota bacterium]